MRIPMMRRPSPAPLDPYVAEPRRPIEALQAESRLALPPEDQNAARTSDLVDLTLLDPLLNLDIRFATPDNVLGTPVYEEHRAFLQRPAAEALIRVQERLNRQGYGLTIYDAYRPWYISKMLWDTSPASVQPYFSDPSEGSPQNRGCTVELSLYDLQTGRPIPMPSVYLEYSPRARAEYQGGTPDERYHRELLRRYMQNEGFSIRPESWWRFDYKDWDAYPILNTPFTDVETDQS
jgi:D-alanyl-D-alanine dipeptidase